MLQIRSIYFNELLKEKIDTLVRNKNEFKIYFYFTVDKRMENYNNTLRCQYYYVNLIFIRSLMQNLG